MFVITQSPSYKWAVTVETPSDGSVHKKETFDAEFKRLPQSRITELVEGFGDNLKDIDIAREVLVGWAGINDAEGNEVPFTDAMKVRLLDIPAVATSIVTAYIDSITGAKRKN